MLIFLSIYPMPRVAGGRREAVHRIVPSSARNNQSRPKGIKANMSSVNDMAKIQPNTGRNRTTASQNHHCGIMENEYILTELFVFSGYGNGNKKEKHHSIYQKVVFIIKYRPPISNIRKIIFGIRTFHNLYSIQQQIITSYAQPKSIAHHMGK